MPWTESRTRDRWLAEVRRRGERIRRRRRVAGALVGALALVLPVSAVATLLGGRTDGGVALTAAGPVGGTVPPVARPGDVVGPTAGSVPPERGAAGASTGEPPEPAARPSPTTTAEVHGRVAGVNGSGPPRPATSVPPADDPVVRPAPISGNSSSAGGAATSPAIVSTSVAPPDLPQPVACPASDVRVTVTTEKATYMPGETVRGSSTLENRFAIACLVPTRAFFRIEDGAGRIVGSFANTTDFRMPMKAEPGKTVTGTFTWDQKDCSGPSCAQVPAGVYVAVADWTEGGPYAGRGSFRIAP